MGIERHLRPLRVHQATSRLLEVGILKAEPPWYRIVAKYPPSTSLVRERARNPDGPPFTHGRSKKKSQQFFQPKEIKYPEDEIRTRFYRDHPWELARPRIIVENDGKDSQHYDWSSIVQARKQLDGESVVQRELWLRLHGCPKDEAYKIAREEFYFLRMRQDIERVVAAEEAEHSGAIFGKSYMDIGFELEQQVLEKWKERATKEQIAKEAFRNAASGLGMIDDDDDVEGEPEPAENASAKT